MVEKIIETSKFNIYNMTARSQTTQQQIQHDYCNEKYRLQFVRFHVEKYWQNKSKDT